WRSTGDGKFEQFPSPITNVATGIWGTNAADVWVAAQPDIWHFTTAWTHETVSPGAKYIWGSSTSDVYAGGSDVVCGLGNCSSVPVIYHRNGPNSWTKQYSDSGLAGPVDTLDGLWGSGPNDLFAGRSMPGPLHSKGDGAWTAMDPAAPTDVTGIWGTSATDVWLVGPGVYHYNGSATGPNQIASTFTATGVWGTSDGTQVFVVGADSDGTCIYHLY
ncbi:MAG TPA: hypothetical protein VHB97_17425, partial [Polyangia bacterium]|nr:hypothetical protein [Polyangia bacterium]